jgi:CRP-like cAMP-binding protein
LPYLGRVTQQFFYFNALLLAQGIQGHILKPILKLLAMTQCKTTAYNTLLYPVTFIEQVKFTDTEKELLYNYAQVRICKRNERISSENSIESFFSFVIKGLFVKFLQQGDKKINTQFATNGDILCATHSYFAGTPSSYCIDALEESTIVYFSKKDMDYLFSQGENFTALGGLIMAQLFLQFEEREKGLLLMDAAARLKYFMDTKPALVSKLTQVQIASYLNIQPETFSKLKKGYKTTLANL